MVAGNGRCGPHQWYGLTPLKLVHAGTCSQWPETVTIQ